MTKLASDGRDMFVAVNEGCRIQWLFELVLPYRLEGVSDRALDGLDQPAERKDPRMLVSSPAYYDGELGELLAGSSFYMHISPTWQPHTTPS